MGTPTVVGLVLAGLAAITAVPWPTYRLLLQQDSIWWLREYRAQLYVGTPIYVGTPTGPRR